MKYAEVLFQQKVGFEKGTLTYSIPHQLKIKKGQNVLVKIRNRDKAGIVLEIHSCTPPFKCQPILKIIEQKPILSKKSLKLLTWMKDYYFCTPDKILKLLVPKKILEGKEMRKNKKKDVQKKYTELHELTEKQKDVVEGIAKSQLNKFLIHGITGSGKTEVYTHLAKKFINKGQQVLILVPEISLTPQIIEYFESRLHLKAAIIHSKRAGGEKYRAWKNIWKNKSKLIIGSRSAIFSPFQDLGLIIIDEEHEFSYKQDSAPRYKTHHIADKLLELNPKTKLIFGSATPSVETITKLKDSTFYLNERIGSSVLPQVHIVDLREEFKKENYSIFSEQLREELIKTLKNENQAMLFVNRRGAASSVVCRDCGHTVICSNCEQKLTYHARTLSREKLICHHCGLITDPPTFCPNCESINIKYLGIGTQKIENELKKEFPQARTLRADKDTTGGKDNFKNIYKAFRNHEADILIGTQMIAKGLHLPKVDLVGVILADIGLNIPDFRTSERNFQLLTQVAGRAGRGDSPGKVIIQSYNPDNIALKATATHNFTDFLTYERTQRRLLKNPPFGQIAKLIIQDKSELKSKNKAEKILNLLTSASSKFKITTYPAYLYRFNNTYRNIILIKGPADSSIHNLLENLSKELIADPSVKIDIDPISTT
ncbi:primosomal protein N' [Candidatus Peregrinibacteria bacterium]|nr:primosomal protein N' [Candidatus Peregrinibacteria bacterium]